jgi:hypothetical protein
VERGDPGDGLLSDFFEPRAMEMFRSIAQCQRDICLTDPEEGPRHPQQPERHLAAGQVKHAYSPGSPGRSKEAEKFPLQEGDAWVFEGIAAGNAGSSLRRARAADA